MIIEKCPQFRRPVAERSEDVRNESRLLSDHADPLAEIVGKLVQFSHREPAVSHVFSFAAAWLIWLHDSSCTAALSGPGCNAFVQPPEQAGQYSALSDRQRLKEPVLLFVVEPFDGLDVLGSSDWRCTLLVPLGRVSL